MKARQTPRMPRATRVTPVFSVVMKVANTKPMKKNGMSLRAFIMLMTMA